MMTVLDAYAIPIAIALLIGVAIAWWLFRRGGGSDASTSAPPARGAESAPPPPAPSPPPPPAPEPRQGGGVADEIATAAADVSGDIIGVEARSELPGATARPDDLTLLKGVGPKFAARLNELGVSRFDQIAAMNENEVEILDAKMGAFRGRMKRDQVVEQATYLARGDVEGFEARFGKLGGAAA